MEYIEPAELEQFYGKPLGSISPTDTPLPKYVCGGGTIACQSCGDELDVYCPAYSCGVVEVAYCDSCEIQHERARVPVSEDINYQYSRRRTDEREEYVCSDCHERHPITTPDGEFEIVEPSVGSYEPVRISCPCGETVDVSDLVFPSEKSCENCSRVYSFDISGGE